MKTRGNRSQQDRAIFGYQMVMVLSGLLLVTLSGCNIEDQDDLSEDDLAPHAVEVTTTGTQTLTQWDTSALFSTVCDPFDGEAQDKENGLTAELYYLNDDQPNYSSLDPYFSEGHKAQGVDLYFSQVNVPTRSWSAGFQTESGALLARPDGEVLHEYFALRFKSNLELAGLPEGRYQFAVASDDGANLYLDNGNGLEAVVENDGTHPTRFACGTQAVEFDDDDSKELLLDYYQGPRYHISVIVLWRQIPEGLTAQEEADFMADSACGKQGNSKFFDFTKTPSEPTAYWNSILDRGWEVVKPKHFVLEGEVEENPCAEEWEVAGLECYTETIRNTQRTEFTLAKENVDPQMLRVFVDGQRVTASFDAETNTVSLGELEAGLHEVKIDYCLNPDEGQCTGLDCGGVLGV